MPQAIPTFARAVTRVVVFITWLVYVIYLHLRTVMGVRMRRASWVVIVCLIITVVSLFGVPSLIETIYFIIIIFGTYVEYYLVRIALALISGFIFKMLFVQLDVDN
jgi:hypothetical protein